MSVKNFTLVVGFVFLVLGLLQAVRIIYGLDAVIGEWSLPLWVSGAIALFAFSLSFHAFKISNNS